MPGFLAGACVLLCRLRLVRSGIIGVVWVDGRRVDCGGWIAVNVWGAWTGVDAWSGW